MKKASKNTTYCMIPTNDILEKAKPGRQYEDQ